MEEFVGRNEKLLSRPRKEILLKSVIQAIIPTYLMVVYKLPCSMFEKFSSPMARFFWGANWSESKNSLEELGRYVYSQILGWPRWFIFKDLRVINDALLGRQAWRLVQHPDFLMGYVIKAKYYPKKSFL